MSVIWAYLAVGALIGFLSGLFGVGGSGLSTPALKLLFPLPDLVALASPLPVTIPTALSGAYSYWRRGLVRRDVLLWTTIGGLPGVILGALGTRVVAVSWLMGLTGLFVVLIGLRLLTRVRSDAVPAAPWTRRRVVLAVTIGAAVGILSGLLANGGGFLMVPAFVLFLGLSMSEAAATSLVAVAIFAIPGTLVHWWLGHIDWLLVGALSVGSFRPAISGRGLVWRSAVLACKPASVSFWSSLAWPSRCRNWELRPGRAMEPCSGQSWPGSARLSSAMPPPAFSTSVSPYRSSYRSTIPTPGR